MSKETIDALPSTVELLITMSAGLDHIDLDACKAKGKYLLISSCTSCVVSMKSTVF